jgi:hypothetical protein
MATYEEKDNSHARAVVERRQPGFLILRRLGGKDEHATFVEVRVGDLQPRFRSLGPALNLLYFAASQRNNALHDIHTEPVRTSLQSRAREQGRQRTLGFVSKCTGIVDPEPV